MEISCAYLDGETGAITYGPTGLRFAPAIEQGLRRILASEPAAASPAVAPAPTAPIAAAPQASASATAAVAAVGLAPGNFPTWLESAIADHNPRAALEAHGILARGSDEAERVRIGAEWEASLRRIGRTVVPSASIEREVNRPSTASTPPGVAWGKSLHRVGAKL
jgi:hypothetical protein